MDLLARLATTIRDILEGQNRVLVGTYGPDAAWRRPGRPVDRVAELMTAPQWRSHEPQTTGCELRAGWAWVAVGSRAGEEPQRPMAAGCDSAVEVLGVARSSRRKRPSSSAPQRIT